METDWGADVGVTEQVIALVDKSIPSPNDRTIAIYKLLRDQDRWDVVCFCIGFLASQVPLYPMFGPAVKNLGQISFLLHYLHPDQIDPSFNSKNQVKISLSNNDEDDDGN